LRNFRRQRPWLRENYSGQDFFDYLKPIDGKTAFVSLRNGPAGEQLFSIMHMEGKPLEIDPLALDLPGIAGNGWEVVMRTPGVGEDYQGGPIVLKDSMGLLLQRYV
jgi:hypothetical protein